MIRRSQMALFLFVYGSWATSLFAADPAMWLGCFGKAKQHLTSEGQQQIVSGFNQCASDPSVLLNLTTKQLNRPECGAWKSLSPSCQQFAQQCALNRSDCEAALDTVLSCTPWTAAANAMLSNTGVESAAVLTKLVSNFAYRAAECRDVDLPLQAEPPLFYKKYCDDSDFSVGFYELNERFYREQKPEIRALLLSEYGDQELGEPFQRIVATAMAVDALSSKFAPERAAGAKVLGTQGDFSAVSLFSLITATTDRKAVVRREAAKALRLQGNKSFLVAISLIRLVLGESDPDIIAEASIALRDQGVTKNCPSVQEISGVAYESQYYEPKSLDPRSLHFGVPACRPVRADTFPNPLDENDVRAMLGKQYGCPETPQLSAQPFDSISDLASIKEFDIVNNRCAIFVPRHEDKVLELARLALINAANQIDEKTPRSVVAKAKVIASLRTLGVGDAVSKSLLFDWAESKQPEFRAAAVYALSRVASGDPRLLSVLTDLVSDPSPLVRRIAIGVAGEVATLSIDGDQKNLLYYQTGIREFTNGFRSCATVEKVLIQWDLLPFKNDAPAVQYFNSGFNRAKTLRRDLCLLEAAPRRPAVLISEPENGEGNFIGDTFRVVLNGDFDENLLRSSIVLASQTTSGLALPVKSFEVTRHLSSSDQSKVVTEVQITLAQGLLPGVQGTILIDKDLRTKEGLGFSPESNGSLAPRKIAFAASTAKAESLIDGILTAMQKDADYDVRFSAAAVLNIYRAHEPIIFSFLKSMLKTRPAAVVDRASRFFNPELMKYSAINDQDESQRADFLEEFANYLMQEIERFDRTAKLDQVKSPDDFLEIPAISSQLLVLKDLFNRGFVNPTITSERLANIKLNPWLWRKVSTAKPLASDKQRYPLYARLLWGESRETWLDIDATLNNSPANGETLQRLYSVVVKPGEGTLEP